MFTKTEIITFLEDHMDYLRNHLNVKHIGIFGSFARDEQSDISDIDILVQFQENTPNLFEKRLELKEFLQLNFGRNVDICHKDAIKPVFRDMILKEAIYV
ncbi:MAG: nucleotidyltransferase family protein [Bacteroidetes bacterium]|nr:nucleotidyltransferase family protein [Bacteroidota bacterium]